MILFSLFLLSLFYSGPFALAAGISQQLLQDDPDRPWHITADEVSHDLKNDQYTASGNVIIQKKDRKLTADFVRFDHRSMKAVATGRVMLTTGEDIVRGSRIEIDLKTETGTVYDGTLFIKENHFYIHGAKIQKVGKNTYTVERARITTCDGETPAWKITGRNLKITIEGYGTVNHAALWAKRVPVLYSPYLVFPVKIKRQSGFLLPQFGISERKGVAYLQPYFWAISENSDATFYFQHMQERGEKVGAEYRYILRDLSKGAAMADGLYDRKVDDGTRDSSEKWGYPDDEVLRPNNDRYWFRAKHDQKLPYRFSGKLDLDIVSDQDYLNEFRSGYTGFDDTNAYYYETFGRALDDYNDPIRVNRLNLNRIWPSYSLNAEVRWNDDVIYRRQKIGLPPLQQLPFVGFDASKQQLFRSPFYFDLTSSYVHFYQQAGRKAHRGDLYPRVYLPYKFKNYLSIEPSAGLRGTAWYISELEDPALDHERTFSRNIYDLKLDLTSDIYKVFNLKLKSVDRIKHALRPQIVYLYIPDQDQDRYPFFDAVDRIEPQNLITYSLSNTFTSRSAAKAPPAPPAPKTADPSPSEFSYHQFSRLKLEQSYDINKANDNEPEPFSPISGEFDFVINRYFSFISDASWSPYESRFLSHNLATSIADRRNDRLFVEHRYTRGENESLYGDILLNVTGGLSAYASYERNILDDRKIASGVGVRYKAQCWAVDVRYIDEETDRKFEFLISLYGLGEAGTSIAGRAIETPFQ